MQCWILTTWLWNLAVRLAARSANHQFSLLACTRCSSRRRWREAVKLIVCWSSLGHLSVSCTLVSLSQNNEILAMAVTVTAAAACWGGEHDAAHLLQNGCMHARFTHHIPAMSQAATTVRVACRVGRACSSSCRMLAAAAPGMRNLSSTPMRHGRGSDWRPLRQGRGGGSEWRPRHHTRPSPQLVRAMRESEYRDPQASKHPAATAT